MRCFYKRPRGFVRQRPFQMGAAVCLSFVALTACWTTQPWELVDVELSVADSVITPSIPLEFEVTAVNRGPDEVTLRPGGCPPTFDIRDSGSRIVAPGTVLCTLEGRPPWVLAPGASVSYSYRWSGEDYSRGGAQDVVPAGDYLLQGWVWVLPGRRVHSSSTQVRLRDGAASHE